MARWKSLSACGVLLITVAVLASCNDDSLGNFIVQSLDALAGTETEEVRIAGQNFIELDKGDPTDGFVAKGAQLCVTHNPGCHSWIFSSGNDGNDRFFTPTLQLPPLAFLKRVEFTPYFPNGLGGFTNGNVWGSGSYKVTYTPPPDISDPQTVHWENSCQGDFGDKPVAYSISFIILKAKQANLGETSFDPGPITDDLCKPKDFSTGPTTTMQMPTQTPALLGWSGGVKACNVSGSRIVATLHLEAHCASGDTSNECKMNIDLPNLVFDPFSGPAGATVGFTTPQNFKPGSWVITLATLTTPDPFGELPGVPITKDLPGSAGNPVLDFTGGQCN
jgi:hypothetical protein